jgi:outer membrane protein assembly factor BamB
MAPQYVDGEVLVGLSGGEFETRGSLSAYDATTGKIAWRIKPPYKALSGMVVAGNLVFFGQSNGRFEAVDARTGRVVWSYMADMPNMGGADGSPAVYVINGREYVVMAFGGNRRQCADYNSATSLLGDALVAFALPAAGDPISPHVVTAHPALWPSRRPGGLSRSGYKRPRQRTIHKPRNRGCSG